MNILELLNDITLCGFIFLIVFFALESLHGFRKKKHTIGDLRIDTSDEADGPYLFLELDQAGYDKLNAYDYVVLKVVRKNYQKPHN